MWMCVGYAEWNVRQKHDIRGREYTYRIVSGLSERELAILRDHYREVYLSNAANAFRAVGIRLASCIPTSNVQ